MDIKAEIARITEEMIPPVTPNTEFYSYVVEPTKDLIDAIAYMLSPKWKPRWN